MEPCNLSYDDARTSLLIIQIQPICIIQNFIIFFYIISKIINSIYLYPIYKIKQSFKKYWIIIINSFNFPVGQDNSGTNSLNFPQRLYHSNAVSLYLRVPFVNRFLTKIGKSVITPQSSPHR